MIYSSNNIKEDYTLECPICHKHTYPEDPKRIIEFKYNTYICDECNEKYYWQAYNYDHEGECHGFEYHYKLSLYQRIKNYIKNILGS